MSDAREQIRKIDMERAQRERLRDIKSSCGLYSLFFVVFMLLGGICTVVAIEGNMHGFIAMVPFAVGIAVWCALQRGDLIRDISILESQIYNE